MFIFFSDTNKKSNKNLKTPVLDKNLCKYIKDSNTKSFDTFSKKVSPSLLSYKNYSSDFYYISNSKNIEKL